MWFAELLAYTLVIDDVPGMMERGNFHTEKFSRLNHDWCAGDMSLRSTHFCCRKLLIQPKRPEGGQQNVAFYLVWQPPEEKTSLFDNGPHVQFRMIVPGQRNAMIRGSTLPKCRVLTGLAGQMLSRIGLRREPTSIAVLATCCLTSSSPSTSWTTRSRCVCT
jgi:hypothetical protein